MKTFTWMALGAAVAFAAVCPVTASAQDYLCDPSNSLVLEKSVSELSYIVLSDRAVSQFEAKGTKMAYIGPDGQDFPRPLYYWAGIGAGDESMPRVDFDEGGYISQKVLGNSSWSGAGIAVREPLDLTMITNDTRFHMAYMTPTENAPESVCFILLDKPEIGSTPGKFAIGANYNDNGVIIPTMGAITADWQGLDFSIGDLKKLWPAFNPNHLDAWEGNLLSWLAGNTANTTFAIDAVYFYNVSENGGSGVAMTEGENLSLTVTDRTVNVLGGQGIVLCDMAGRVVKSTEGSALGLDGLQGGVYVARSGNKSVKVSVR